MAAEKNFENKVKAFLKDTGAWLLKYWGGAAYTKSGIPDLLVCSDGCFLGIEVKAPNGEPSLLQLVNLKKIRESGGYGILLYPKDFEQFKMFIAKKSELNAWYLSNIEDQKRWEIKPEFFVNSTYFFHCRLVGDAALALQHLAAVVGEEPVCLLQPVLHTHELLVLRHQLGVIDEHGHKTIQAAQFFFI